MSLIQKPMLAATIRDAERELDFSQGLIGSPKLDGIRCLRLDGKILSRSLKPIPNRYIVSILSEILPEGADGEIMAGKAFQDVTSAVMSRDGEPDFCYWMFDYVKSSVLTPYADRIKHMRAWDSQRNHSTRFVKVLDHKYLLNHAQLMRYEAECLTAGYEGVILRHPDGPYKSGRSTLKQQWLLKLKRFEDSEAEILGFEEQEHNQNELQTNELGHAKRSSSKAGKVKAGTLGKFLVRDLLTGVEFAIGTGQGLTAELRKAIWDTQDDYLGKVVKYKFQPVGVKVAPRLPIYLGFRSQEDM